MTRPLSGVRVVDMTTLAMGPLAAQILGDYGADVVKVEAPGGDPMRAAEPMRSPGMGHVFLQFNRNKRSLAIDAKAPGAREALLALLGRADVFLCNVRPAAMRRLGLDAASVRAINPRLVYCAAYGFSEEGPYAGRPAADDVIQAMSGLAELQGRASGGPPQLAATLVADKAVGLMLVNAVLAALIQRGITGEGQSIEAPMFEAMVSFVLPEHMGGLAFEPVAGPSGYGRIVNPMRRPFRTADGYLCVLPYTTPQWRRFFALIGRDDLGADPALVDPQLRLRRSEELYGVIADAMPARRTAEWVEALRAADILFGEVMSPEALLDDPHLQATGTFARHEHPTEGAIRLLAPPIRSSAASTAIGRLPPRLGEHSREVLLEAGLPAEAVDALIREGVVQTG